MIDLHAGAAVHVLRGGGGGGETHERTLACPVKIDLSVRALLHVTELAARVALLISGQTMVDSWP